MSKHQHDNRQDPRPYFSFSFIGRLGRLEFANRFVTYLLLFIAIYLLYYFVIEKGLFALTEADDKTVDMTKNLVRLIFYAGFMIAVLLLNIRLVVMRLHDINLSGWWASAFFIFPYLTDLLIIMLPMTLSATWFYIYFAILAVISLTVRLFPFVMPGTKGLNRYGTSTKTGKPFGALLLLILLGVGGYFLYRYITLQSVSVAFLYNL